jgi:N-acetylglutamate synthase-like GNAT family acetyltransferase
MRTREQGVTVRPALPGDMPAIRTLIRSFPSHLMQQDVPRIPSFFVAEREGRIVGCCALQIYSKRLAEIRSLAVDPKFQNRGVATKLLQHCEQRARERGIKQLLAVSSNATFFENRGFRTFLREKIALFYDVAGDAKRGSHARR